MIIKKHRSQSNRILVESKSFNATPPCCKHEDDYHFVIVDLKLLTFRKRLFFSHIKKGLENTLMTGKICSRKSRQRKMMLSLRRCTEEYHQ